MKNKRLMLILGVILSSILVFTGCGPGNANNGGADGKIKISIGKVPYEDMWLAAHVIDNVAQELGYETEIVEAEMGLMYQAVASGSVNVFQDVCLPVVHQPYVDQYEGQFEIVGTYYKDAPSGLTVPTYVDIDSITDLIGREAEFNNRIVGVEPSAGLMLQTEEAVKAYGLDGYQLLESSTPAMLGEVTKAVSLNQPILFTSWRPHAMYINFDIKILEDPKGIYPRYDVQTAVNNNLKNDAPDLYKFIEEFNVSLEEIEAVLTKMDQEKTDIDVLAKEWIEENREEVDKMLGK